MTCKRKLLSTLLICTLLAIICYILSDIIRKTNNVYYISSMECYFENDMTYADLTDVINKAIKISQEVETNVDGSGESVIQKGNRTSTNLVPERKDNSGLTCEDKEKFRDYLLNVIENKHTDIIFSEEILYIVYIEKEQNQSFNFAVKPVYYEVLTTTDLNELFIFRKKPKDVFPEEIVRIHENNNSQTIMCGIYFYSFNEPTVNFRYSLTEELISPYSGKREISIEKIGTEIYASTADFWARTYLASPPYNKDYSSYIYNLTLSVSDNNSEIISNKYIYDISILVKSTNYIHLSETNKVKAKSELSVNKEIENFDFVTEIVTQNFDKVPSYTINFKCSIN